MARKSIGGAKSKYTEEMCIKAEELASEGLIDVEIAKQLGIGKTTYYEYQLKFPEFAEAIKKGKSVVDDKVESVLLKRALGYSYKEKKVIVEMDKDGNQKPAKIETVDKEVIPSDTALIFWLQNRRPDRWRDMRKFDFGDNTDVVINVKPASEYKEDDLDE